MTLCRFDNSVVLLACADLRWYSSRDRPSSASSPHASAAAASNSLNEAPGGDVAPDVLPPRGGLRKRRCGIVILRREWRMYLEGRLTLNTHTFRAAAGAAPGSGVRH